MERNHSYRDIKYEFGRLLLSLRTRAKLTQGDLARLLGISIRTIQNWEAGESYPKDDRLRSLIETYLRLGVFQPGKEQQEALHLWEQVSQDAPHKLGLFDRGWFDSLLQEFRGQPPIVADPPSGAIPGSPSYQNPGSPTTARARAGSKVESFETPSFYGREKELATLGDWVGKQNCRVIALLGIAGVGKTGLTATLTRQLEPAFDFVIERSLFNAPSLENLLDNLLQFLAGPIPLDLPVGIEGKLKKLLAALQNSRILIVLNNWEAILQGGKLAGTYRPGYENYSQLLEQTAQTPHRSCLIFTSREKPLEFGSLEAGVSQVHSLTLAGLEDEAACDLLENQGLHSDRASLQGLTRRYAGNPLALKLIAEPVQTLFGGNVEAFLKEEWSFFGEIEDVLSRQFRRLSELEQQAIFWLALEREPVSLDELEKNMLQTGLRKDLLEALLSLDRRSLLEKEQNPVRFGLQPVVTEFLTEQIIEQASREFETANFKLVQTHTLLKAQAKDFIKIYQRRFILGSVLKKLKGRFSNDLDLDAHLVALLAKHREQPIARQGYEGSNVINLLRELAGNLNGYDFSGLRAWQVDLQGIELQRTNFAGSDLRRSSFTQAFDSISAVAFSPDGRLVAGGSYSGEIRIWDLAGRLQLTVVRGHTGTIWSMAFSPDGKTLASGSTDQTVKLWDITSGDLQNDFVGHANWIRSVAFSPDGTFLASGSNDQTVRLWDVESGQVLRTLQGHSEAVWSVAFSPDGKTLASGSADQTIKLWEVARGENYKTWLAHEGWVRTVAFNPDGQLLASGSNDQTIKLWDLLSEKPLKTFQGHTNAVDRVVFSPDGKTLASASDDFTIKLWEVETAQYLRTLQGHTGWVRSVAFSPDGKYLVSGSIDQSVKLWEIASGECLYDIQGHTNWIRSVVFSPDDRWLASSSTDRTIKLWEVSSGNLNKIFRGHDEAVWSVAFSPDSKFIASGSTDQTIKLWEVESARCLQTLQGHTNAIWTVEYSPDGRLLASGSADNTVRLWEVATGKCRKTLAGHSGVVGSVTFSPNGQLVASASDDGTARLWEVGSGKSLVILQGHGGWVRSVAFSPDGQLLATGSSDSTIKLWNTACGKLLKNFDAGEPANAVWSVAFSPDGQLVAGGYDDHTVKLWDVASGECRAVLSGHTHWVFTVNFSPGGQLVASGGTDQTIKLWDASKGEVLNTLRASRPYEGMNITGVTGITEGQKANLIALGALTIL